MLSVGDASGTSLESLKDECGQPADINLLSEMVERFYYVRYVRLFDRRPIIGGCEIGCGSVECKTMCVQIIYMLLASDVYDCFFFLTLFEDEVRSLDGNSIT